MFGYRSKTIFTKSDTGYSAFAADTRSDGSAFARGYVFDKDGICRGELTVVGPAKATELWDEKTLSAMFGRIRFD
jgi:hypothetical protein